MTFTRAMILAVLFASGCSGQVSAADDDSDPTADGAPVGPDAAPGTTYAVTGTTKDYSSSDPLPDIALATEGLVPALQTQSDPAGAYTLAEVPASSSFYFRAMPSGTTYMQTVNPPVTVLDADLTADVRVVSMVYAQRQHTTADVPRAPGNGLVLAQLQNLDNSPWEGVPIEAITLIPDGTTTPVPINAFFIGATGDVDLALLVSTAFPSGGGGMMPKARVALLDVPPGVYTMSINFTPPGTTETQAAAAMVSVFADAATIGRVVHDPATDTGGVPGFTGDVYPILQRASQGGQDCASCHTAMGVAGNVLILDDGAPNVHARLLANPLYVDLITPAASLLLTKPLFETPPNHPNAIWLDETDPYYQKILLWIEGGAPLQ
jgi:hypothetical protein